MILRGGGGGGGEMDDFENPNILVVFPVFDFIVKIVISFFDKKKLKELCLYIRL